MQHVITGESVSPTANPDQPVRELLRRMPASVARTFTSEQLEALGIAVASRGWGRHPLDIRGSVPIGRHRYFFAMFAGRNRRDMSPQEKTLDNLLAVLMLTAFLAFCVVTGCIGLYLLKSALGIDLFADYSLGLWGCVQTHVL